MADKTIDDLLTAIETIQALKNTLLDHESLIVKYGERLAHIESRLSALEAGAKPRRARKS